MITLVRRRSLKAFEDTAAALGVDAAAILARTGLDASMLDDPDGWISFPAVIRAYQAAAKQLGDPGFGLKAARRFSRDQMGPLLLCTTNAPNLAESITEFGRFLAVQNTGYRLELESDGAVRFVLAPGLRAEADQWIEESLLDAKLLIDSVLGGRTRLLAVHFQHEALQDPQAYSDLFGAEVHFRAEADMLRLSPDELTRPLVQTDEAVHTVLKAFLEQNVRPGENDLLATVCVLIDALMAHERATLSTVAAIIAMHPRTLQRRLAEQGCDFSGLLEQQRRSLAARLVGEGRLALTHVAMCLGYSEQAAFNHAFRRWFAFSPKAYRAKSVA